MMLIGSATPSLSEQDLRDLRVEALMEHHEEDLSWLNDRDDYECDQ